MHVHVSLTVLRPPKLTALPVWHVPLTVPVGVFGCFGFCLSALAWNSDRPSHKEIISHDSHKMLLSTKFFFDLIM